MSVWCPSCELESSILYRLFPCCYKLAVLEGALLLFTHRQKSRTQPPLSPPCPHTAGSKQGHWARASPALQPQRWAWMPQGTREGPAWAWAVVNQGVGQRAGYRKQSEPVTHSERQREAKSAVEKGKGARNAKVEHGKYSTKNKGESQTKRKRQRSWRAWTDPSIQ